MYKLLSKSAVLGRWVANFARAERGNVAVTFALATLPVLGLVGASVDLSRGNSLQAALQNAVDSTALYVSKQATSLTPEQLQIAASNNFRAVFTRPEAKDPAVTAVYSSIGGSSVVITGSTKMDTEFMGILGYRELTIVASSTTKWGTTRLRVALALDNTGSMDADGKLPALKTATKNLLTQLQAAATVNGDVYVSIIPFSKDVNVGSTNYNQPWIDWTDWDIENTSCNKHGCVTKTHDKWNGCVTDRGNSSGPHTNNYDRTVTAPGTLAASKWPAENYSACTQPMMGLNYDWTAMRTKVDNMVANGSTNQPIGLVWGWQSLVGGGPLTVPAEDSTYTYSKIIILLSDGLNTQNRWYGNGSNVSTSVDKRMYDPATGLGTCANIKAAGITIYAIQVNTGGDPTSTLLKNCASATDKFFELKTADQIVTTFEVIGTYLTKLRLTH